MSNLIKSFAAAAVVATGLSVQPLQAAERDFTLIVAPARYSVIQMAFDLIKKRPAVLVSYRGEASTQEPLLYAWNGTEWVYVSMQDYREVRFLQDSPRQVVLLGDENTLPTALKDATGWSKNVQSVKALDNAALVNEFGRLFKWTQAEWQWFASRYNLKLQDEAEPYRRSSWYDQTGPLKRDEAKNATPPPAFTPSATPDAAAPVIQPPDLPPVKIEEAPAKDDSAKAPPKSLPAATP